MEGVNNKINILIRQADGYRDEACLILKLLFPSTKPGSNSSDEPDIHQGQAALVGPWF